VNALDEYKINEASKTAHEFIWADFCDWYIEVLKTKLNENPEHAEILLRSAFEIFEKVLKMLHPIMPFITEELWQLTQERKAGESISTADFPVPDLSLISDGTEKQVSKIQDIITAIRNLRSEMNINPSAKCRVLINCKDGQSERLITGTSGFIISLSKLEKLDITRQEDSGKPGKLRSVSSVVDEYQIYLLTDGLIDIEKERMRLNKEIERMEVFLAAIDKKLNNDNFTSKASPEIVSIEKKKSEDARSKLERLKLFYESLTE
jgi:valyl-tRNA synthetase